VGFVVGVVEDEEAVAADLVKAGLCAVERVERGRLAVVVARQRQRGNAAARKLAEQGGQVQLRAAVCAVLDQVAQHDGQVGLDAHVRQPREYFVQQRAGQLAAYLGGCAVCRAKPV
jgi:hypothetical protein